MYVWVQERSSQTFREKSIDSIVFDEPPATAISRDGDSIGAIPVPIDVPGRNFAYLSSQPLSIIRGKGLSYKKVHTHEGKTVGEGSEGDSGFVACVREQVDRQV